MGIGNISEISVHFLHFAVSLQVLHNKNTIKKVGTGKRHIEGGLYKICSYIADGDSRKKRKMR